MKNEGPGRRCKAREICHTNTTANTGSSVRRTNRRLPVEVSMCWALQVLWLGGGGLSFSRLRVVGRCAVALVAVFVLLLLELQRDGRDGRIFSEPKRIMMLVRSSGSSVMTVHDSRGSGAMGWGDAPKMPGGQHAEWWRKARNTVMSTHLACTEHPNIRRAVGDWGNRAAGQCRWERGFRFGIMGAQHL